MDREDPLRQTAATASFLQASLFTSILAFGVAAMAVGMGVLFVLIGLGISINADAPGGPERCDVPVTGLVPRPPCPCATPRAARW